MTRPKRILVAYSMSSTFTGTTLEYLMALKSYTNYEVCFVHVTHNAQLNFDLNEYDVLFQNYCARLCFEGYVSSDYEQAVMNFRGLKILAVQDDYDHTATLHRGIRRLGFHVLLTCIQPAFWHLVYPKSELPGLKIINGLTGYMPERLIARYKETVPLADRKVWVAYRGRDVGPKYGRLGFEKYEIGKRMREICEARKVPHDIAMDHESRIYGDRWFDFLGSSRAMLGAESGSNAFDFDGILDRKIRNFTAERRHSPSYHDFKEILEPFERPFDVGQISPRVFECALMRTPMILFRGRYSDAIEPGVHYLPLEHDFSNAEDILSKLQDIEYLEGFADRAYERLVASGKFGYRSLAKLLEETIQEQYPIWVDSEWQSYRGQTAPQWSAVDLSAISNIEERELRRNLLEVPHDLPLGYEDFSYRQEMMACLRFGLKTGTKTETEYAPKWTILLSPVRFIWRRLPFRLQRSILSFFRYARSTLWKLLNSKRDIVK